MTKEQESIIYRIHKANACAEYAYWWMKNIDANDIDDLGVMSKIQDVLELLRKVDDITMDIVITIKNKSDK